MGSAERIVCGGDHVYPKPRQTLDPAQNLCVVIVLLRVEILNFDKFLNYQTGRLISRHKRARTFNIVRFP